jgi:hypothetical protein
VQTEKLTHHAHHWVESVGHVHHGVETVSSVPVHVLEVLLRSVLSVLVLLLAFRLGLLLRTDDIGISFFN